MSRGPKRKIMNQDSAQAGYAAESPFPCRPREPLASAHINKLMIIAKEKNHTQDIQTCKG